MKTKGKESLAIDTAMILVEMQPEDYAICKTMFLAYAKDRPEAEHYIAELLSLTEKSRAKHEMIGGYVI